MRRAAIYNRWWYRKGGGELHALAFVPVLEELGFRVHVVTTTVLNREDLEEISGVDLSNVVIQKVPDLPDYLLGPHMPRVELFVNASQLEALTVSGAKNITLVYFPAELDNNPRERLKRMTLSMLQNFLPFIKHQIGVSPNAYLQKKSLLTFSHQIVNFDLKLQFDSLQSSLLEQLQFREDSKIVYPHIEKVDLRKNIVTYSFSLNQGRDSGLEIIFPDEAETSIMFLNCQIKGLRAALHRFLTMHSLKLEARLRGGATSGFLQRVRRSDLILANSKFTSMWISRLWGLKNELLYPPVDLITANENTRKNRIVSTGRFFAGGHNKKQLELVKAFRVFVKNHPDWEMHFIGRVGSEDVHQEYFRNVESEAKQLPVFFHVDAEREEVELLLKTSKVYWQATGFNEDEDQHPERSEHFGIALIEAMSAGCVCFAYNGGGVPEILDSECGYKWNTLEELVEKTNQITNDPEKVELVAKRALKRSRDFSRETFEHKLKEHIKVLCD